MPEVKRVACATLCDVPHYQIHEAYKDFSVQGLVQIVDDLHVQSRLPEVLEPRDIRQEIKRYAGGYEIEASAMDLLLSAGAELVAQHFLTSGLLMLHAKSKTLPPQSSPKPLKSPYTSRIESQRRKAP